MVISTKAKKPPIETDKGVPLAPSEKDLKPWYSDEGNGRMLDDMDNDKRYVIRPVVTFLRLVVSHISHPIRLEFAKRIVNRKRIL
jgi:hypothetical protein